MGLENLTKCNPYGQIASRPRCIASRSCRLRPDWPTEEWDPALIAELNRAKPLWVWPGQSLRAPGVRSQPKARREVGILHQVEEVLVAAREMIGIGRERNTIRRSYAMPVSGRYNPGRYCGERLK